MNLEKFINITRFLSTVTALILVPAIFIFFGFALLASYDSWLRFFMMLMVVITAAFSLVHAFSGKTQKYWLISVLITVSLFLIEPMLVMNEHIKFCKEEVLSECALQPDGKITCPPESLYSSTYSTFVWHCENYLKEQ